MAPSDASSSPRLPPGDERYRLLVDAAVTYAIVTMNLDRIIETWNPGAEAIFGWPASEVVGRSGDLIFTPEDRAEAAPRREAAVAYRDGRASDDRWHVRRDGSLFMANGMMIRLDGPDGTPLGFGKILRDVTDKLEAQAALAESEERFRTLADSISQLAWMTDPDGTSYWFNQRWYDYTGTRFEDARGWGWAGLLHPDHADRVLSLWRRHLAGGEPWEDTFPIRSRDGGFGWFLSHARPIHDAAGNVLRWFVTSTDITQQRETEAALRHTQKLESIGVLAGGIAHDFNNLLTGVIGNASLGLRSLPPEGAERLRPLLEDVLRAGKRAAGLTQQLLAYAGKAQFAIRPVDLCTLIRDATSLLDVTMPPGVTLELSLPARCPPVNADASQLQQLVVNLVTNAAEAMEQRAGRVLVEAGPVELDADAARDFGPDPLAPGRYIRLRVTDGGVGMPPELQARMFEPFYTTKFLGRGLGLAAVHGIVRAHRGGIAVASEAGRGTAVTVVLPMEPPARTVSHPAGAALTVLVIDAEALVRAVARETLSDAGYAVIEASDGAEGVARFLAHPGRVDVVLLDVTLPGRAGAEIARRIRAAAPEVGIVATSGYSTETLLADVGDFPVNATLQKPFTRDQLVTAVTAAAAAAKRPLRDEDSSPIVE